MSATLSSPPTASATSDTSETDVLATTSTETTGILIAFFSLLIGLAILPPMFWHFRNRNIGATVLVGWIFTCLFFTFVNACIWSNDDISSWYNGAGLCDVEVKLWVGTQVGFPASFACVLRALAAVLDTDSASLVLTKAKRRRNHVIDLSWCIGFPMLQMLFHYIVQPTRYYLYGISGCVTSVSNNWLSNVLIVLPPFLWCFVDGYYAVLILIRLYRYRLTFNTILASSNTPKSRFLRLYIICLIWILAFIPVEVYLLVTNTSWWTTPFSWSEVHSAEGWATIIMVPAGGSVVFDRWIWLACGVVVFAFFGFGREAWKMYRACLRAMGLARCFPSLDPTKHTRGSGHSSGRNSRGAMAEQLSSASEKAKKLFSSSVAPRKKSTVSTADLHQTARTWSSASATTMVDPSSPRKSSVFVPLDVSQSSASQGQHRPSMAFREVSYESKPPSRWERMTERFRPGRSAAAARGHVDPDMQMEDFGAERPTVEAAVMSRGSIGSSEAGRHEQGAVMVRKEIRQASEYADGSGAMDVRMDV